jgi:hypothetical protein
VFVAVSRTDTVCEPTLVTQACDPFGVTATPHGPLPTETVATTMLVAASITETVSEPRFVT